MKLELISGVRVGDQVYTLNEAITVEYQSRNNSMILDSVSGYLVGVDTETDLISVRVHGSVQIMGFKSDEIVSIKRCELDSEFEICTSLLVNGKLVEVGSWLRVEYMKNCKRTIQYCKFSKVTASLLTVTDLGTEYSIPTKDILSIVERQSNKY